MTADPPPRDAPAEDLGAPLDEAGLAPLVYAMGRGPGRARSLERDEAAAAMRLILSDRAAPEAVGALLMLMRYRGETPAEIAGFVEAMRAELAPWRAVGSALDWPAYAAGRSRGLPWFLLAAKLLAEAGAPTLIHGWSPAGARPSNPRSGLAALAIPIVETPEAARAALARQGIAYAPLEAVDPRLLRLLRLRERLGLRSAVNTCLRCLNPTGAAAAVQGVFHPPYRALQQHAAALLGERDLVVLKGGGGEFERHPAKAVTLFRLADGAPYEMTAPPLVDETRRLADPEPVPARLAALWTGASQDPFAEAVVLGTAAAALLATGRAADLAAAEAAAQALWRARRTGATG